MKEDFTN